MIRRLTRQDFLRVIGGGVVGATLLGTSGCGGAGGGGTGTAAVKPSIYCGPECQKALKLKASPESIDCTVGISWSSTSFPYGAAIIDRAKKAQEKFFPNMQIYTADGQGNSSTQASQVSDFVGRGIDVLIISPTNEQALIPAVKQAQKSGIKVIASDRDVATDVLSYVGPDNVKAGTKAAKYIVEQLKGKGNVVEISGSPGASPTNDRHKGFLEALGSNPKVKVIASQSGDYNRAEGLNVMQDLLQRFTSGKIDAVFAHNDEMAFGAIQAIKEARRSDEIIVVGIDGEEAAFKKIKAGDYAATVVYPLTMPESLIAAAKVCAKERLPARIEMQTPLITKENVNKYMGTTF